MKAVPPLERVLPAQPSCTYGLVGECIYCGAKLELSDEHIIPYGLGGRLVLPKASCSTCAEKTSKFERTCLRTMYGPLRLLYGLPSRRKDARPETLDLRVKRTPDSPWEDVPVAQERFPFLITFPMFDAPGLFGGTAAGEAQKPAAKRFWIRGASPYYEFFSLLEELVHELKVHTIMPVAKHDVPTFCSMLAKIALSAIVARGGRATPQSTLARIAVGEDMDNCLHYIGAVAKDEPPSAMLHELSVGRMLKADAVVVRIRLLARLGTPTYMVVVPRVEVGPAAPGTLPDLRERASG
jgi:hypothetical protein